MIMSLYYKTLRICNKQQMNKLCSMLVFYIVCHKQDSFYKHTSLPRNLYITNLECFIVQGTKS